MNKPLFLVARLHNCVPIILMGLAFASIALDEVGAQTPTPTCAGTTQVGQQFDPNGPTTPPVLPTPIGKSNPFAATADFFCEPFSNSASVYVCIDDVLPQNLQVVVSAVQGSESPASLVLWDHEAVVDQNNQPVTHIEAVANIPFAGLFPDTCDPDVGYSYEVRVIDDQPGDFTGATAGTFNSSILTLNPNNPGHLGLPTVNLYADTAPNPVPTQIEFGTPLSFLATAIGNPSSYQIDRLGIKINEIVDLDPLHPDPAHPLPPCQQHNSGIGPGSYQHVVQSPSPAGVTLAPDLPPGLYQITATAWDSAGFSTTVTRSLMVTRSFGLLSVSNLSRSNSGCDQCAIATPTPTPTSCGATNFVPTTFNATLNLINNTDEDSGNLRVRLVSVPGVAFIPRAFVDSNTFQCQSGEQLTLPEEQDLTPNEGSVGPVAPLLACSAQQVEVCGVIPAPQQLENCPDDFGFGFQVYAVLEQCDASAAECADPNLADLWIPVDSIRVTEGEWPFVGGFGGPGGGVNNDRRGARRRGALVLNSIAITSETGGLPPTVVTSPTTVQYHVNAVLKNSARTITLTNVMGRNLTWTSSSPTLFPITPTGVFTASQVSSPTSVTLTASYRFPLAKRGVTKSESINVTVNPPGAAASVYDRTSSNSSAAAANRGSTLESDPFDEVSSQIAIPAEAVPEAGVLQRQKKRGRGKALPVSLSVSSANISEGDAAIFTISARRANPSKDVTINYSLGGPAVLNTHYVVCGNPGQVIIPAGQRSARVTLSALANDLNNGSETATLTLLPGAGYKASKKHKSASVTISNSPAPACP